MRVITHSDTFCAPWYYGVTNWSVEDLDSRSYSLVDTEISSTFHSLDCGHLGEFPPSHEYYTGMKMSQIHWGHHCTFDPQRHFTMGILQWSLFFSWWETRNEFVDWYVPGLRCWGSPAPPSDQKRLWYLCVVATGGEKRRKRECAWSVRLQHARASCFTPTSTPITRWWHILAWDQRRRLLRELTKTSFRLKHFLVLCHLQTDS